VILSETIGSISFLANTPSIELSKITAGLVLICLGRPNGTASFKHSRRHWVGIESAIDEFVDRICVNDDRYFECSE
jgi:aminopeptidase-like protein